MEKYLGSLSTMPQYQCVAIRCHKNWENVAIHLFSFEDLNESHLREKDFKAPVAVF